MISLEFVKLGTSNFVCSLTQRSTGARMIDYTTRGMCSGSRDFFKFWEISGNISEMVQDRHIVSTED